MRATPHDCPGQWSCETCIVRRKASAKRLLHRQVERERKAAKEAKKAAERAAVVQQAAIDSGAIKVAVVTFALAAKVPGPLQALRAEANDRGHVGVVVGLHGRSWPLVTNAWPAFSVHIEPSSARWVGPITGTCADVVERAIRPWAAP